MDAEIIAVGSELLTPYRLDTNSLFLTGELNRLGFHVRRKHVVGDRDDDLRDVFLCALERVDVVVSCGGLGPTEDDRTREIVAEALGRKLKRSEAILRSIQERFRKFGRTMPEVNVRQAMVPEGAEPLPNSQGTAPGLWLESDGKVVVLLPGPPAELQAMFLQDVKPRLARRGANLRLYTRDLRTTGLPESEVDQRVASIYKQYAGTETTILAAPGEIQLHPRVWSEDEAAATKLLDEITKRFALALGENLFSTAGENLETVVANQLQEHRATIAVAESCTGGMLAARLTNVPGSSSYFRGGVVSYSNDLKSAWVDVPREIIEAKGAVSSEVALAMADGIRRRTDSTLGVGVTGIAGPGGGTPEKPVGLVHIAIADEKGTKEREFRFPGTRDRIRHQATQSALDMVRRYFLYAASPAKG
ncbi:MAG TPA: competence/damage-inducible protein A [Candidatus Acidoferrales bacterium]|nr:competence/damage-inducible protein A [Candidatus Acidoferrales bacterium]